MPWWMKIKQSEYYSAAYPAERMDVTRGCGFLAVRLGPHKGDAPSAWTPLPTGHGPLGLRARGRVTPAVDGHKPLTHWPKLDSIVQPQPSIG